MSRGAAKGKQPNTEALCQPPPPLAHPTSPPFPPTTHTCVQRHNSQ